MISNLISVHKTVDVEIKTNRALTESRGGEKPAERSLLNGPLRAQSKAVDAEYSAT